MILHWYDEETECYKAVRNESEVFLYNEEFKLIKHIFNIGENEWSHIILQNGEWSDPSEIPSTEEKLYSEIDFLTMENESLRADVDYLLMMIGEA